MDLSHINFNERPIRLDLTNLGLFSGCYDSLWLSANQDENDIVDRLEEDTGHRPNDVSIDFKIYLERIADLFINNLESKYDLNNLTLGHIWSPPYYNFDTDHIVLHWDPVGVSDPESTLRRVLAEIQSDYNINDDGFFDYELYGVYYDGGGHDLYIELVDYSYIDNDGTHFDYEYDSDNDRYFLTPMDDKKEED